MLVYMGYVKEPPGMPVNYTGFFDFNSEEDQSWKDNYMGYRDLNE